jgi:hypothetical protein
MIAGIGRHLRRQDEEAGLGMVLVMGIVVFVAALTATAGTIAINGLAQSRQRIHFEQSLAAAESGVDYALGELQKAFDISFADFPVPNPGNAPTAACTATTVQLPTAANTPRTWNERAWADGQLDALEAAPRASGRPSCLLRTPIGDALVLKPLNAAGGPGLKYGRVYARGWSPRWGDPRAVERTIKVEYVFMPYQPQHAVLTGSSLDLQGSYLVDEAQNVTALAGVHTNGSLTVTGNGGDVSGPVTYGEGSAPGQVFSSGPATKLQSKIPIPTVSARQLYAQAQTRGSVAPGRWRDLCPDGLARDWSANGPCTGAETGSGGWQFSGSSPATYLWTANRNALDGTYFVWKANATNGSGNYDFGSLTVIAAASEPASRYDCPSPRYGGSIIWDHYDVGVPNFSDMWFLADQDLEVHANFDAGSNGANPVAGTYIAGEEINLWTSSSMLVGSVLAANQCDNDMGSLTSQGNTNEIQGQDIWFKPNADSPFSSVISTTLWLEY